MRYTYLFVLVLAAAFVVGCAPQEEMTGMVPHQGAEDIDMNHEMPSDTHEGVSEQQPTQETSFDQEPDVVVVLGGRNFEYVDEAGNSNPDIVVAQGDLVRIEYTTLSGVHDLRIDAYAATSVVQASAGVQVLEFVADQAGTFEYYCSVGSHRAQGMVGRLIVE